MGAWVQDHRVQAFKDMQAELVSLYAMQRKQVLSVSTAELAQLRGGKAYESHMAAAASMGAHPKLLDHATYSSVHRKHQKLCRAKYTRHRPTLSTIT